MADAEEIVGEAWVQVLIGRRELAIVVMQAAAVDYDNARQALAITVLECEPAGVAAARIRLEQATGAAREAAHDYERAHRELVRELDLLAWCATERIVDACLARGSGSPELAGSAEAVSAVRSARRATPFSHPSRGIAPLLQRVARTFRTR